MSIPGFVLSGGQYDRLMSKLHNNSKAIGFAVYLDMLEELGRDDKKYDADTLVIYDSESDLSVIRSCVCKEIEAGNTVAARENDGGEAERRSALPFTLTRLKAPLAPTMKSEKKRTALPVSSTSLSRREGSAKRFTPCLKRRVLTARR